MKNLILFSLIALPAILFIDIIVMITIGCVTSLFGFTQQFYECTYCNIAKFVFLISFAAYFIILVNVSSKTNNTTPSLK